MTTIERIKAEPAFQELAKALDVLCAKGYDVGHLLAAWEARP